MIDSAQTPAHRLRAVVVGVGQAGSRFDDGSSLREPRSHVGAYLHLADVFQLCAAADVSAVNAEAFRARCPTVPIYGDLRELIARHRPEVASICTPAATHGEALFKLLECPDLRLIWCEKPLSIDLQEGQRMVDACEGRGVRLMVSFNRRWQPLWQRVRALIQQNAVGPVRSIRVAFPNRLFSIGSHAADLALMLGGPVEAVAGLRLPALDESGEPAVSGLLQYRSGAGGVIQVTGLRSQLIVEAEVIGDDGRLWAREDQGRIVVERFAPSPTYAGYRQPVASRQETIDGPAGLSAFLAMAENAADALNRGAALQCNGVDALEVQRILKFLQES